MITFKLCFLFPVICLLFSAFTSDIYIISLGTKTLYKPMQTNYSSPPAGYEPVFINYAGRHGARFQTSITSDSILYIILKNAAINYGLTEAGKKLMCMDSLLINLEKLNISYISERGKEEQESIGKRMAKNFHNIFTNKNGLINVSTTKKERTRQSARAFLEGLNTDTSIHIITNYNDNDELAFYDVSPAYKQFKENGSWKNSFLLIQHSSIADSLYKRIPEYFFTASYISKLNDLYLNHNNGVKDNHMFDPTGFSNSFYEVCSIIPSLDHEIASNGYQPDELNFISLVSDKDINELNFINCAEDYLLKGPGTDTNGIQIRIAAPLLVSFLNAIDAYISSGKVIASLNFGHAETIAPFAALLGIKGASESVPFEKIQEYNKSWICENIIPLSANIQWVLYKNSTTQDLLIKILLNEREVRINGLKDSGIPFYYKWNDVRNFYIGKLEKMRISLNDNMHDYLTNVQ